MTWIKPPPPGIAVMACRCGAMLDSATMLRLFPRTDTARASLALRRIVCETCATADDAPAVCYVQIWLGRRVWHWRCRTCDAGGYNFHTAAAAEEAGDYHTAMVATRRARPENAEPGAELVSGPGQGAA